MHDQVSKVPHLLPPLGVIHKPRGQFLGLLTPSPSWSLMLSNKTYVIKWSLANPLSLNCPRGLCMTPFRIDLVTCIITWDISDFNHLNLTKVNKKKPLFQTLFYNKKNFIQYSK